MDTAAVKKAHAFEGHNYKNEPQLYVSLINLNHDTVSTWLMWEI